MKLQPTIIFITLGIFILSGCQFLETEEKTKDQEVLKEEFQIEKKVGILSARAETEALRATHELKTDAGETFSLRSGSLNLRKYEKRNVEVEGKFATTDGVFEVENIKKLGREDDVRNFYRYPRLGFSITYLPTWEIVEKESGVLFTPYFASEDEAVDRISVTKLLNEKKLGVKEWLDLESNESGALASKDPGDDAFYVEVVIGPDQISGIKRTSRDGFRIDFFVTRDDAAYRLTHTTIKDGDEEKYRNIFFETVNSFQFIPFGEEAPSTETTGGAAATETTATTAPEATQVPETLQASSATAGELTQTLESLGFQITMRYPKNWYWAQSEDSLVFSEKPIDENGEILLRINQKPKNYTVTLYEYCRTVVNYQFCFSHADDADGFDLKKQMLETIELYQPQE